MILAQVSDTHVAVDDARVAGRLVRVARYLDTLPGLAAVVVTGDVTSDGLDEELDLFHELAPHDVPVWSLEELSNAALLSWVLTTAVTVVVGRCFAARARHNAPGGVVNIGLEVLLCGAVAGIAGHLTLPGLHPGLVYGLAAFVAHAGFAVAMKEWEPGMTSDEFDATMAEFRAMTKEHFAEDVENVRQGARARLRADWEKKQARRDR